jgi:hypothetical protein
MICTIDQSCLGLGVLRLETCKTSKILNIRLLVLVLLELDATFRMVFMALVRNIIKALLNVRRGLVLGRRQKYVFVLVKLKPNQWFVFKKTTKVFCIVFGFPRWMHTMMKRSATNEREEGHNHQSYKKQTMPNTKFKSISTSSKELLQQIQDQTTVFGKGRYSFIIITISYRMNFTLSA